MTLYSEIKPYVDGNGLVSYTLVPPGTKRASDNGPLFTSQYLILLHATGQGTDSAAIAALEACIDSKGRLHRAPDDPGADVPDDHYGVLSAARYLNLPSLQKISLTPRCYHPALLFLRYPILFRWLALPIAVLIALSNAGEKRLDTSNKMLTWTLIKGTNFSWLCRLGGAIWRYRMGFPYLQINEIPRIYFGKDHPIAKFFVG